ncbi:MAG: MATE family efflux transporter, partial [Oscillospiraceae bacterium]|nr:MATE family efflux transporter [Oscillospiraceae bacterium]
PAECGIVYGESIRKERYIPLNLTKYVGDRNFWRVTLRLALPIAFQNMLTSSFSLVDTLMVSMLGDISLAATGMAGQWSWLLNIFLFGVSSGAAIFISQYFGVDDRKGIHRTSGIALFSGFLLGALFMAAACFFPSLVMRIFGDEEAVIAEGVAYLRIAGFSYFAVVISGVWSSVLRSTAQVRLPMYVALITTFENAGLNYLLIFGGFGIPALGIRGAALATVISSWTGALLLLVLSLRKGNILYAPFREIFRFTKESLLLFYRKALPVMFNESLWGLGTFCFNAIFGALGYENYEAVTIVRTFENIAFAFFVGLCNACCVMVGKSVGAGKIERSFQDARRFAVLIPLVGVGLGCLIIPFRSVLVSVFNLSGNISASVLHTAEWLLVVYGLEVALRNVPYIQIVGVFRSGGDTVTGVFYDMICLYGISLPATLIAAFWLKLPFPAVFAVMYVCEDVIKSILCIRHFRSAKWLRPVTPEGKEGLALWKREKGI